MQKKSKKQSRHYSTYKKSTITRQVKASRKSMCPHFSFPSLHSSQQAGWPSLRGLAPPRECVSRQLGSSPEIPFFAVHRMTRGFGVFVRTSLSGSPPCLREIEAANHPLMMEIGKREEEDCWFVLFCFVFVTCYPVLLN